MTPAEPMASRAARTAACLGRVLRSYGQLPADYQDADWQVIPDARVARRWQARLRNCPTAGLDTAALALAGEVSRYYSPDMPGGRVRPRGELVAIALAIDAQMRRRGYLRPEPAYTDGWHQAPLLALQPDPASTLARVLSDDTLRGIADAATYRADPDQSRPCRFRQLASLAQRERGKRASGTPRPHQAGPALPAPAEPADAGPRGTTDTGCPNGEGEYA
jgi:hypothetical protein